MLISYDIIVYADTVYITGRFVDTERS